MSSYQQTSQSFLSQNALPYTVHISLSEPSVEEWIFCLVLFCLLCVLHLKLFYCFLLKIIKGYCLKGCRSWLIW